MSETSWEPKDDDNGVGGPGLVGSLWRYRLVIVAVTVLAAVAGCGAALLLPSEYEAQASLYLRSIRGARGVNLGRGPSQSGDHAVFMATQAAIAGSDAVYDERCSFSNGRTPADIRQSVVVGTSADLTSITITATAGDPVEAAAVANAVGNAYQQVAGERRVDELDAVLTRLREVRAQREAELDSLTATRSATLERRAMHVANLIGTLQVDEDNVAAQAALYGTEVVAPAGGPAGFLVTTRAVGARADRCRDRFPRGRRLGLVEGWARPSRGGGGRRWRDSRGLAARRDTAVEREAAWGRRTIVARWMPWMCWIRSPRRATTSFWPPWSTLCPGWEAKSSPW